MSGFINCQLKPNQVLAAIVIHLSLTKKKSRVTVCCIQPFDDRPPLNEISPGGKVLIGRLRWIYDPSLKAKWHFCDEIGLAVCMSFCNVAPAIEGIEAREGLRERQRE